MNVVSKLPELRFTAVVVVEISSGEDATGNTAAAIGEKADSNPVLLALLACDAHELLGETYWIVLNW